MPPQAQPQQQGPAQQPQPQQPQQAPQRSNAQKLKDVFKRNADQSNAVVAQQITDQIKQGGAASVTGIVGVAKDKLKGELKADLAKRLQIKLQMLQEHAKGAVGTELDALKAQLQATDRQLADVKAGSAALAGGAAGSAITSESEKAAGDIVGAIDFSDATAAGSDVYAHAQANATKGAQRESLRVHDEAAAAMAPAIKQHTAQALLVAKTNAAGPVYDQQLKNAVAEKVKASPVAKADLQKRTASDGAVEAIAGTAAATAAFNAVHKNIQAYIEDKLGAKGAHFWRPNAVRQFRKQVKAGAREQARTEVDKQLGQGGGAEAQYQRMVAKSETYDGAKEVVNKHLTTRAADGTKELVDDQKDAIVAGFITEASPVAWAAMRSVDDPKAANAAGEKAAAKAIAAKQQTVITDKRKAAATWAETIVGDGKAKQGQAAQESTEVKKKIETDKDKEGKTVAQRAVTAANGTEALGVLGTIIDLAAPHEDTACELEVSFKIPMSLGGFLEFSLKGSAEREHDGVKAEIAFLAGGGFETFGAAVSAHFQMFLEAKGKTTRDTVLLLQYGLYRRFTELSADLAAVFAGTGRKVKEKRTGMSPAEMNETWAAMVEDRAMADKDSYVNSGVGVDLGGKFDIGALKGEGRVEGRTGTRYDKATLDKSGKRGQLDHAGSRDDREKTAKETATAKHGASKSQNSASAEFAFDIQAGSFRFGVAGSVKKETGEEAEAEFTLSVPFTTGNAIPPGTVNAAIGKFIPMAAGFVKNGYKNVAAKDNETSGAQRAGSALDGVGDALSGVDTALAMHRGDLTSGIEGQLSQATFGKLTPTNFKSDYVNDQAGSALHMDQASNTANAVSTESALEVALGIKYDPAKKEWVASKLAFTQTKKMEIGLGGFGAGMKVSVDKKQKLAEKKFGA